jgi:hypothetical protein
MNKQEWQNKSQDFKKGYQQAMQDMADALTVTNGVLTNYENELK